VGESSGYPVEPNSAPTEQCAGRMLGADLETELEATEPEADAQEKEVADAA
jgi:hypothetical protein